jgi:ribosome-associated protein
MSLSALVLPGVIAAPGFTVPGAALHFKRGNSIKDADQHRFFSVNQPPIAIGVREISLFCTMHFKPPYLLTEFVFKTSRSGGKGGQNVNKVSTKVMISFSIVDSALLSEEEKSIMLEKLTDRLTKDGAIQIVAQEDRTQLGNKEIALKKMYAALNKCFIVRKKRKATKPSKGSVEKRLQSKKRDSEIKRLRKGNFE